MPALKYFNLFFINFFQLIKAIIQYNYINPTIKLLRDLIKKKTKEYILKNNLLYYKERFIVLKANNFYIRLIQKVYDQIFLAYFGTKKT